MDDLSRLRTEYADRAQRLAGSDRYSWFNAGNLFAMQGRARAVLGLLRQVGCSDLGGLQILEVGCGGGGVLSELVCFGAAPRDLFGLDLLTGRLAYAGQRLPGVQLVAGDGSRMPFPPQRFDLVLQFTALSSILDAALRRQVCDEMARVLRPGGLILSYDFWLNPTNRQTRGLTMREVRQSFPGWRVAWRRITLAPPIARRLAPVSWGLCLLLESLKVLNTHYLVAIRREG